MGHPFDALTAELPLWTARLPATSGTTAAPRRRQNGIAAVVDFFLLAAVVHGPLGLTPRRVSRADRPL